MGLHPQPILMDHRYNKIMLKDVIAYVSSRTGETNRDILLREINFAWKEFWNSDDVPNSLFEITVKPFDTEARITLPWYVDMLRGVKQNGSRNRITLNTPRSYYQDGNYAQSPWTWRILGNSPLTKSIDNATQFTVSVPQAETAIFKVTLRGPTDNAEDTREELTFQIGTTSKTTTKNYTDLVSVTKDVLTAQNVSIINSANEEVSLIPNNGFQANNTIVQIVDKCSQNCVDCSCFDILFKAPCPYLFYDDTVIPFEEVLMAKTLEWMTMPKNGEDAKAAAYAAKAGQLLNQFTANENSVEKRLDLGKNSYTSLYYGHL